MHVQERIIVKYLAQRWHKKALIITDKEPIFSDKINVLKKITCSGYLKTQKYGCIFNIALWPFEYKFFDLIILDQNSLSSSKDIKILLKQLYFCLSDDGEVIVSCLGEIRLYKVLSKFLSKGFINKRIYLLNPTNNIIINLLKRIVSRNFVAIFRKDHYFIVNSLKVSNLVSLSKIKQVYISECFKERYEYIKKK